MNKYDNFINRTNARTTAVKSSSIDFIENSASSIKAKRLKDNSEISVVLINERKEGGNETILFSYKTTELEIGELVQYRNKQYLIYSQYEIIFNEDFLKHKLIECNVELKWGDFTQKGYFISSLRSYENLQEDSTMLSYSFSDEKPIIITKTNENIKAGTRFLIYGDAYLVKKIDKISNRGIYYISLEPSVIIDGVDNSVDNISHEVPEANNDLGVNEVESGSQIQVETNFGYATFSSPVNTIHKTINTVIFEVPYGIEELVVKTKDINGDIVEYIYKVVV